MPGSEIRARKGRRDTAARNGGRALAVRRINRVIVIWGRGAVLLREAEMFVVFQWHDGSEGSGDGVSPPRPQAERLPGRRVQLLARQSALLTCGEGRRR